jgi:phosphatidylglycerophosphate synthase
MADRVDDPPASGGEAAAPDFVLELLAELRAAGYHAGAWGRFFARSWQRSRATARAHPALVRSWGMTAIALGATEAGALALEAGVEGERSTALRAIPGAALAFAFTHFDVYCHLGMNARRRGDEVRPDLGLPTRLTLARGACAGLLWGHLLGGRPAGRPLLLAALAGASVTDIADGAVARATDHVTRLGQYADSQADFGFGVAYVLTLAVRRRLPRWLVALLLARWLAPFAFALASYFGWVRRVPIQSSTVGRVAGVAQAATLAAALLPDGVANRGRVALFRRALHVATAGLLVAAPLAQAWGLLTGDVR